MPEYKLGKLPRRDDPRTLLLENYLDVSALPPIPTTVDYSGRLSTIGMMRNDVYGDCVVAAKGHSIQTWSANANNSEVTVADSDITADYFRETGGPDSGLVILTSLNDWRNVGLAGHRLYGYASVNPHVFDHVRASIFLFGICYLGVELPLSAQQQIGGLWDINQPGDNTPGSWGGHALILVGYSGGRVLGLTWGQRQWITQAWLETYCSEAYAVLGPEWFNVSTAQAPSGFNLAQLNADLPGMPGNDPVPTGNPQPTLSSVSPSSVVEGSGPFTLTAMGTNFVQGAVVDWNGAALSTSYVGASQLTAQVPAIYVQVPGQDMVAVVNPDGGGSLALPFAVTAKPKPAWRYQPLLDWLAKGVPYDQMSHDEAFLMEMRTAIDEWVDFYNPSGPVSETARRHHPTLPSIPGGA